MRTVVIAVSIQYNSQPMEEVFISKYGSRLHFIFGIPNGKTVAEKFSPLAMDFEMHLQLPISQLAWLENV